MNWYEIAAGVSLLLSLVSLVPYVRDIIWGTTRPNIVTWGLWTLIQGIATGAQLAAGASWSVVLPAGEFFTVGLVTLLGLIGYGYKKYGKLDVVSLLCCLLAIALWQLNNDPTLALVFSIVADFFAALPTLKKAYTDPASETLSAYVLVVVSALLAGLSSTLLNFANLAWPAYILFINGAVVVLILLGRRLKKG